MSFLEEPRREGTIDMLGFNEYYSRKFSIFCRGILKEFNITNLNVQVLFRGSIRRFISRFTMHVQDVQIFFSDNTYTADIKLDTGYIVTEGKSFDELIHMIDDALQGIKNYSLPLLTS